MRTSYRNSWGSALLKVWAQGVILAPATKIKEDLLHRLFRSVLPVLLLTLGCVLIPVVGRAEPLHGTRAGQLVLPPSSPISTTQVIDLETGDPIPGVVVSNAFTTTMADLEGQVVWPEQFPLTIKAPGYQPRRLLYPTARVALQPLAAQGQVVDPAGDPVSGAIVAWGGRWSETDAAGRFAFQSAPEAGEEVIVKRGGYRPYVGPWDGEAPLTLEPIEVRALYVSFPRLTHEYVEQLFERMSANGLNAVVVDAKSDRGLLAWKSEVPLASEIPDINDKSVMKLPEFLELARRYNLYTVARIVTFKDHPLATTFPERAVRRGDGSVWIDAEELGWADPYLEENWDYNIDLGLELAEMGFDEINYDYIRLPTDGAVNEIVWPRELTYQNRTGAISAFLAKTRQALRPTRALLSGDVFGLVPTVTPGVDMGIGQTVETMMPYLDIFCPMVYPSTFQAGNLGLDDPHREPYEVVYRSVVAAARRHKTPVRPWLQGYSLGVEFGPAEWSAGVQAALDSTDQGFTFWLASGRYDGILTTNLPTQAQE